MSRAVAGLALAAVVSTLASETARAQAPVLAGPEPAARTHLLATNAAIQASLERIATGSALWRQALDGLSGTGRYALILTPEQVVVTDAMGSGASTFDATVLAEVAPVAREDSRVSVVLVVVNLTLLQQIHESKGSLAGELDADLDRILVHEIYGHALPYLIAGNLSGRCADPGADQQPSDACSIRRENAVRAELGLGRRTDYGLEGLTLARRGLR